MKKMNIKAIAAAFVATVALSCIMTSCEGRKMSNMEPTGETVEVDVDVVPAEATVADSII